MAKKIKEYKIKDESVIPFLLDNIVAPVNTVLAIQAIKEGRQQPGISFDSIHPIIEKADLIVHKAAWPLGTKITVLLPDTTLKSRVDLNVQYELIVHPYDDVYNQIKLYSKNLKGKEGHG